MGLFVFLLSNSLLTTSPDYHKSGRGHWVPLTTNKKMQRNLLVVTGYFFLLKSFSVGSSIRGTLLYNFVSENTKGALLHIFVSGLTNEILLSGLTQVVLLYIFVSDLTKEVKEYC